MLVTDLWESQPGRFFCLASKGEGEDGDWRHHFFERGKYDDTDVAALVASMNGKRNVYFCPHGFSSERRTAGSAVAGVWLYADLDAVDPAELGDLEPTAAIESSPGRYVGLWRVADGVMTWPLNQRLTYTVRADSGGWAPAKVLRMPGTANLKYDAAPKARVLWRHKSTGYELGWLDGRLRRLNGASGAATAAEETVELLDRLGVKGELRIAIMTRTVPRDRSKVLHRVVNELAERHGLTSAQICDVVRGSKLNKWAGHDDRLMTDVVRIQGRKFNGGGENGGGRGNGKEPPPRLTLAEVAQLYKSGGVNGMSVDDTLQELELDWAWRPYLLYGSLTVLAAAGNVGKGLVCCDIVARITRGEAWPCGGEKARRGNVLWMESEDPIERALVTRLRTAGADTSRVVVKKEPEFFRGVTERWLAEHGIGLIVLSPLLTYAGVDDHNDEQSVRTGLSELTDRIENLPCAVVGIMHPNKKIDLGALERLLGSVAFRNFARSVVLLKPEEEEGKVRFVHAKYNLSIKGDDLLFAIHSRSNDPRHQKLVIEWEAAEENIDPDSVFDRPRKKSDDDGGDKSAKEWLLEVLKDEGDVDGWHLTDEIFAAGERRTLSKDAIRQAKTRLGKKIETKFEGFPRRTYWRLNRGYSTVNSDEFTVDFEGVK